MNSEQKHKYSREEEPMTAKEILAAGWDLTSAILALKGVDIPETIDFQVDGRNCFQATRVATLEELAMGVAALHDAIEHPSEHKASAMSPYRHYEIERLIKNRDALVELQKRAGQVRDPASTTVIEALFPDVPVNKKTAAEKAKTEEWLAIRKEEGRKIDPETAEVMRTYTLDFDPYGVMDEWELPEEFRQTGNTCFARAPGSDIWVAFRDLPDETHEKLWNRVSPKDAFPVDCEDDVPF
jgi:hypothetical protein